MNAAQKLYASLGHLAYYEKEGKSRKFTKKGPGRSHANGSLVKK